MMEATVHGLTLQIETSSTCNASCHFCPYITEAKTRSGKEMPVELFHKIVDEAATIDMIEDIKLMGLNEPLLDRRLEDFIAYIKSKCPRMITGIYTNGLLLTKSRHDSLQAAGLDNVTVSLNAVNEEQHSKIMGMKGKFKTICENIEYAKLHQPPRVEVHGVLTTDTFTFADAKKFYERWGWTTAGSGIGFLARYGNWAGDHKIPDDAQGIVYSNLWCHRATGDIYVTFDGKVTTCCMDPFGRQVWGNLNTQSLREIYASPAYYKFREAHSQNRADEYEQCRNCTRI